MLSRGGKLALGAFVIWLLATFGSDFLINPDSVLKTGQAQPKQKQQETTSLSPYPFGNHPTNNQQPISFSRTKDHLAIGTFNIQVFGVNKMGKPNVMAVLVDVARQFDVLAIQEVRAADQSLIPHFVELLNAEGRAYSYVLGPRQGNTVSKEQYVFIFDMQRVEQVGPAFMVPDPQNLLHREPMVATFRTRGVPAHQAFTFTLMNIHTDPDVVEDELASLPATINYVRQVNPIEDDVILLGDLNASPRDLGGLATVPNIAAVLSADIATNTRGTRHYDNLLIDRFRTAEFSGYSGVIDIAATYGLTQDEALQVSDHLPVWGLFSVLESKPAAVANQPETVR